MKVKVIKRSEVVKKGPRVKVGGSMPKRTAAREMVSNVTNWVSDFQQRKRDETKVAFEQLFSGQPRPNESL
jgi:hypothetical protein